MSSKNKKEREKKKNNFYPCTTHFATYNVESKVHGHNFYEAFSCITFHVVRPTSRLSSHQSVHPINQRRKIHLQLWPIFEMGPSKFLMSLFSWIWRRLFLVFISYKLKLALLFLGDFVRSADALIVLLVFIQILYNANSAIIQFTLADLK